MPIVTSKPNIMSGVEANGFGNFTSLQVGQLPSQRQVPTWVNVSLNALSWAIADIGPIDGRSHAIKSSAFHPFGIKLAPLTISFHCPACSRRADYAAEALL